MASNEMAVLERKKQRLLGETEQACRDISTLRTRERVEALELIEALLDGFICDNGHALEDALVSVARERRAYHRSGRGMLEGTAVDSASRSGQWCG